MKGPESKPEMITIIESLETMFGELLLRSNHGSIEFQM